MFGISNPPISIEPLKNLSSTQDFEDTYNWIVDGLRSVSYSKISVQGKIGNNSFAQIESFLMRFPQDNNVQNYQLTIIGMPQDSYISPLITISISKISGLCFFQCTGDNETILYQFIKYLKEHRNKPHTLAKSSEPTEDDFLKQEYNLDIDNLNIEDALKPIISERINEISKTMNAKAYLSAVILSGSTLEGVLLGVAKKNTQNFNTAKAAPKHKDTGTAKAFGDWSLSNFIDVSFELGMLKEDTRKFSHALREFRNYIHPNEQIKSGFHPSEHTARISLQVLLAAISQLIKK